MDHEQAKKIAERFVRFVETNEPDGLLADDVFADINVPEWRFQMQGARDVVAWLKGELPDGSRVASWRSDPTASGVVVEVEQRYEREGAEIMSRNIVDNPDPAIRAQERADLDWWIARVRTALGTWSPL